MKPRSQSSHWSAIRVSIVAITAALSLLPATPAMAAAPPDAASPGVTLPLVPVPGSGQRDGTAAQWICYGQQQNLHKSNTAPTPTIHAKGRTACDTTMRYLRVDIRLYRYEGVTGSVLLDSDTVSCYNCADTTGGTLSKPSYNWAVAAGTCRPGTYKYYAFADHYAEDYSGGYGTKTTYTEGYFTC